MPDFYSEGNLIVRTDSYEQGPPSPKKNVPQKETNLWKNKVKDEKNNKQNLTIDNFPTLKSIHTIYI